ncbi:MAG TPA: AAA family ATPase [Syntrophales bacterium]|nr:AAA family ATPase [Syntrophales bacterium]
MRILSVRFLNLNSLTGEWRIDFTGPEYGSDGIFAITGPTGSGKTTVLDAVCLGLYGRTPRLEKLTKSTNEIMSRQTGECFSEVTFETPAGRYRCHWSQRRARKQPGGELQQARHEIADAETGTVLESRITDVGAFIEKTTGMDFERFTRSMLLAQGDFAAFLQAPPGERAPILEQITGTEIYSRISEKVHERLGGEQAVLAALEAELRGIRVLDGGEERALLESLKEKETVEAERAGREEGLRGALRWIETLAGLEREIGELDGKTTALEIRERAFEEDGKRLDRARRAAGLEGDYRELAALRAEQKRDLRERDGAAAALPGREEARGEALAAVRDAEILLAGARERRTSEGEVIRRVRDLDVRLGERTLQREGKDREAGNLERQAESCRGGIERGEEERKSLQNALTTILKYREEHGVDTGLPARLPVIERGVESLRECGAKAEAVREALAAAEAERTSALDARRKAESDHENARRAFEEARKGLSSLEEDMAALLGEKEEHAWRRDLDTLRNRERVLVRAGDILARIDEAAGILSKLDGDLEMLRLARGGLQREIEDASREKALLERDAAALEREAALLGRIRDLEEERKRLEDGAACPLCGSTDHPFARGNVPVPDAAEEALERARGELREVSAGLGRLEAREAATAAEIGQLEKQKAERRKALDREERQWDALLPETGVSAAPEDRVRRVGEELAALRGRIGETAAVVALLDEKRGREKDARKALEAAREGFDRTGGALREAAHRLETALSERGRLAEASAAAVGETETARAVVLRDGGPFGAAAVPPDGFDAWLAGLGGRKAAWEASEKEKETLERRIAESRVRIEKDRERLGALEGDLVEARKERDGLKAACDALAATRRELFGEKNPDDEEKRLAGEADRAESVLAGVREDLGRIEKEIGLLKERIASLERKTADRAGTLAGAEDGFLERVRSAGFGDEGDFLASRLGEGERSALEERERSLAGEKRDLQALRRARSEALAAERRKRLTDRGPEALREELAACLSELKQARLDIGGIRQRLGENERMRERQRERLSELEARKRECARWEDLHRLIGSADGKKFRNFAQGLTFERMIAHANRQLRKMTDRYLLVRDPSRPLELNVIDNYQAGESRSTKNLSGGESFIVSLALALGLSRMAGRNVRVDSLFLDEGFGTLDGDALETALQTLADLRQDGKLIGVISHVPELRERIATRIRVTPGTGGRSTLSGPGVSGPPAAS